MKFSNAMYFCAATFLVASQISSLHSFDVVAPFNINTYQTIPIVVPPLRLQNSYFDTVTLSNVGGEIVATYNETSRGNFLYGGTLPPYNLFIAYQIRYNFNTSIFEVNGVTINGYGTPLQVETYLYNSKYGSSAAASAFPDGIIILRNPIEIGAANPNFGPFSFAISQIRAPGKSVTLFNGFAFNWIGPSQNLNFYYSYTGFYARIRPILPVRYSSGTAIVIPFQYSATISAAQFFQTFSQITRVNTPLEPRQTNAPVFVANGPLQRTYSF